MNEAAAPAARPAKATDCPECKGSGRETVTDEITDEVGEFIGETTSDFGPCEICDGRGWFPRETAAQRRERLAAELVAKREARRVYLAKRTAGRIEHRATCTGCGHPAHYAE